MPAYSKGAMSTSSSPAGNGKVKSARAKTYSAYRTDFLVVEPAADLRNNVQVGTTDPAGNDLKQNVWNILDLQEGARRCLRCGKDGGSHFDLSSRTHIGRTTWSAQTSRRFQTFATGYVTCQRCSLFLPSGTPGGLDGSKLRLQLFALARGMLALACQFSDTFRVGAGLTTIFLPALRHTVARRTGAFRYCCHDFSFLAEHARLV